MIIGTRGSALALAQANLVARLLREKGIETTQQIIKTTGDTFTDRPLHEVAGVGAFVRELDDRMIAGEIDIAVHSMKDLPTVRPQELAIAAVMKRDSPLDVLVTCDGKGIHDLPQGAVVGTTSMRRTAQLKRVRPDLVVKDLRGNINTRLRKLSEGQYDAIFMAKAGLERMGWDHIMALSSELDAHDFVPSANQGTIVIVTRKDTAAQEAVKFLDHRQTRIETEIERIVITEVGGGCIVPIGSFAEFENDMADMNCSGHDEVCADAKIRIRAEVLSLDGLKVVKIDEVISLKNYVAESHQIGHRLVEMGGKGLVEDAVRVLGATRNK